MKTWMTLRCDKTNHFHCCKTCHFFNEVGFLNKEIFFSSVSIWQWRFLWLLAQLGAMSIHPCFCIIMSTQWRRQMVSGYYIKIFLTSCTSPRYLSMDLQGSMGHVFFFFKNWLINWPWCVFVAVWVLFPSCHEWEATLWLWSTGFSLR